MIIADFMPCIPSTEGRVLRHARLKNPLQNNTAADHLSIHKTSNQSVTELQSVNHVSSKINSLLLIKITGI